MKAWLLFLIPLFLSGCAVSLAGSPNKDPQPVEAVSLANLGPAPELTNEVWLNVDEPLRLADLRGKVVLLDMWTFG